jgi:hypothetical protein
MFCEGCDDATTNTKALRLLTDQEPGNQNIEYNHTPDCVSISQFTTPAGGQPARHRWGNAWLRADGGPPRARGPPRGPPRDALTLAVEVTCIATA